MTQPSPVLVGAGHLLQRADDPHVTAEPLAMMGTALEQAAADAGAPQLMQRANSIYVPREIWRYGDPGRTIARRFGAASCESVGTPYGVNFAQACVIDAAREIQAGRRDVVLVAGAENGRTQGQAQHGRSSSPARQLTRSRTSTSTAAFRPRCRSPLPSSVSPLAARSPSPADSPSAADR